MERPKDIPVWAWKKADDAVWEDDAIANNISGFAHELTVVVARAILAAVEEERKACAKLCMEEVRKAKEERANPQAMGAYWCVRAIDGRNADINKDQTP